MRQTIKMRPFQGSLTLSGPNSGTDFLVIY
jgi:hypothetical protein